MKGLRYLRDNHKVIHRGKFLVCLYYGSNAFDIFDVNVLTQFKQILIVYSCLNAGVKIPHV